MPAVTGTCVCLTLSQVEEYVCSKIKRNPVVSRSAAAYLGEFTAGETDAGFTKGDAMILPH